MPCRAVLLRPGKKAPGLLCAGRSWLKAFNCPGAVFLKFVHETVMHAAGAALPEFKGIRDNSVAAPEGGKGYFSLGEFVFQFHQLLPEFTALENVMIPALIGNMKQGATEKKAKKLLAMMGLSERMEHKPAELSGGEKQRVAVARALINDPVVVFADEPSGSLDTDNKAELHSLFFELRSQLNQTFIIVTHDEQLASITDRTIHMMDGRIVEKISD